LNTKLGLWRSTLESKGFRLSRSKTEYLHCQFSVRGRNLKDEVAIGGAAIPKVARFQYLGSIIQEDEEIDEDVN